MMNAPKEIAQATVGIGKGKATNSASKLFVLAFFAGMFIAFGATAANTVSTGVEPAAIAKLLSALVFPTGLAMVLVAGSELFTGNSLIIVGLLQKEVKLADMLKNWAVVWVGNLVGSIFVAWLVNIGGQLNLFNNGVAVTTMKVAASKCGLSLTAALCLGILCNIMVCIAVWMSFGAKTVSCKIVAIYLPIMAFVLSGFEHSVANMYYISSGLFAKGNEVYLQAATDAGVKLANLTWGNFFVKNLIPVTIGNVIGGSLVVGCLYWFAYLKGSESK